MARKSSSVKVSQCSSSEIVEYDIHLFFVCLFALVKFVIMVADYNNIYRKKGRLYFKNGGKAHDTVVITRKYSKFLKSGRVNNMVHVYVGI